MRAIEMMRTNYKRLSYWLLAALLLTLGGCAAPPSSGIETDFDLRHGKASYYSDSLHGNTTASGEPYDRDALTAAHRELPFGTRVRVKNLSNGKTIQVTINDRGPFVEGRIIDLSRRAAEELDMIQQGVVEVSVQILD